MKVELVRQNGGIKIKVNQEIIEPLSFKSFRPTARNISDFYGAGVRLFSILTSGLTSMLGIEYSLYGESWIGERQYDFEPIDRQIELFLKYAPKGYFALMIHLDTRPWWLESHPGSPNSFTCLSQAACVESWKSRAGEYLKAVITHVETKYGERFYGYFLLGGMTTEWFSHCDYEEASPEKRQAYREYTGNSRAVIPYPSQREADNGSAFVDNDNVAVYRKFHAELIADTVLYFAAKAQEVLCHQKLVGVYFGYVLELAGSRLWNDGHLAYEKIFTSPDIDMISSPSSYCYRGVDDAGGVMVTDGTLARHNKLYYLEFDHITHTAPGDVDGCKIPGEGSRLRTERETIDVMRRDYMMCTTRGAALWWFDMFEGWFYGDNVMESVAQMVEISKRISHLEQENASEVLVVISPEALYHVNKNANINTEMLSNLRGALNSFGAPYDMISQCDLCSIEEEKYKLILFPAPFMLTSDIRRYIEERLKCDGRTLLWLYAPDYVDSTPIDMDTLGSRDGYHIGEIRSAHKFSLERISRMCGMEIDVMDRDEKIIVTGNEKEYGGVAAESPVFYVADRDAVVLGRYKDSGLPGLAYKDCGRFTSIYSGRGGISGEVLAEIAVRAQVHLYTMPGVASYINSRVIGIYSDQEERIHVRIDGMYEDVFSGNQYQSQNGMLMIPAGNSRAKMLIRR